MEKSKEIIVQSWNPFTGCTKISPACRNCYAMPLALKLQKWGTAGYDNGFQFTVHRDRIEKAPCLKRKKPQLYFVNNMSDTFHKDADEESIDLLMECIRNSPRHHFYLLTKRSERMRDYFNAKPAPDNLWPGVTVEDKAHGLPRIKDLQQTNCRNRHICCEPLLEDLGEFDLSQIRLVVGGGESGPDARRTQLSWAQSLVRECERQQVKLYWKQWGKYGPDGTTGSKKKTGCLIDGREYLDFPDDLMP